MKNSVRQAQFRQDWLPDREEDLRPTALGNTLLGGRNHGGQPV